MEFLNEAPMTKNTMHPRWQKLWDNTEEEISRRSRSMVWARCSPMNRVLDMIRAELEETRDAIFK